MRDCLRKIIILILPSYLILKKKQARYKQFKKKKETEERALQYVKQCNV